MLFRAVFSGACRTMVCQTTSPTLLHNGTTGLFKSGLIKKSEKAINIFFLCSLTALQSLHLCENMVVPGIAFSDLLILGSL